VTQSRHEFQGFHWLDVVDPSRADLTELGKTYGLHAEAIEDCLQPEHLPKYEDFEEIQFLILRAYDEESPETADRVQALTRKIAVFTGPGFILTVHRKALPFLTALIGKFSGKSEVREEKVLLDLIAAVIHTYDRPVMDCLDRLEKVEEEIFKHGQQLKFSTKKAYLLKRRATVFKRMLRASAEPLNSMLADGPMARHSRGVREHIDNIYFYADDVTDTLESLLTLQISLASQRTNEASYRTNEVMRILTIFSVFFLPINFIASLYGMNFDWMPELKSPYGYPIVIGAMVVVVLALYVWMKRKGWLSRG
jgi:magnesium transporter